MSNRKFDPGNKTELNENLKEYHNIILRKEVQKLKTELDNMNHEMHQNSRRKFQGTEKV